jgi:hypothetical protein
MHSENGTWKTFSRTIDCLRNQAVRYVILIGAFAILSQNAWCVGDPEKFAEYQARLKQRRSAALALRREQRQRREPIAPNHSLPATDAQVPARALGGANPQPALRGYFPRPARYGYFPRPALYGYVPQPALRGYVPQPALRGYVPQPALRGYVPQPALRGYLPQPALRGFVPQPALRGPAPRPAQSAQ